jgi:Mrp family chromosome partitioning ATPase
MYMVGIPHLRVMPSGPLPPDPSELFASRAMQRFFQALSRSGAEVIIFDASSLLELSDALTLSSKVDGTIMVIDPKRVYKQQLKQVQVNLTQAGAHVVGYVMNKQHRYSRLVSPSFPNHYRSVEQTHTTALEKFPNITH